VTYEPRPVDTANVVLPSQLLALIERLAENAHDVWARQRLQEGWDYGRQRDDGRKEHPGLVPYAELSESERQYDRNVAVETLKAILTLGYRILPPETATEPLPPGPALAEEQAPGARTSPHDRSPGRPRLAGLSDPTPGSALDRVADPV
jgi:hypothetical protein